DPPVRDPEPLGTAEGRGVQLVELAAVDRARTLDDLRDLVDEPRIDPRLGGGGLDRCSLAEPPLEVVQAMLGRRREIVAVRRRPAEVRPRAPERAPTLAERPLDG